jgi:hypothetical protein
MERRLSKAITIAAFIGFLVAGTAIAAILDRDSLPAAGAEMVAPATMQAFAPNRASKGDRLAVRVVASTEAVAPAPVDPAPTAAIPSEPLRQAYAAEPPVEIEGLKVNDQAAAAPPKPKAVAKPPAQKSYALLSDEQIAGIKERLKLSPSQEYYWPAVENALRAVAHKIHAARKADPNGPAMPIDPDGAEVQQLKSAAFPLLFQLREDQKQEVRSLARLIGLEKVAAAI